MTRKVINTVCSADCGISLAVIIFCMQDLDTKCGTKKYGTEKCGNCLLPQLSDISLTVVGQECQPELSI